MAGAKLKFITKGKALDIERKVTYETEMNGKIYALRSIKVANVPGFSHKVVIATDDQVVAKDWLGVAFSARCEVC